MPITPLDYRRDVPCGLCNRGPVVSRVTISRIGKDGQATKRLSQFNACADCQQAIGAAMRAREDTRVTI